MGSKMTTWAPLHEGEEAVQLRVGVREEVEKWAPQMIRPFMPEQHRVFYEQLPFMVAGARDSRGWPWATLLVGSPGFVQSPDPRHLKIMTKPLKGDALDGSFIAGAEVGLLGIELETRRRNRVNGTLSFIDDKGFTVAVEQSFGNCPQYISKRVWHEVKVTPQNAKTTHHTRLNTHMQSWIRKADTLFVASGYRRPGQNVDSNGMDVSHRGGSTGFVKIVDATHLVLPDYAGNNLFNTIGNLVMDPQVGLLFVDFEHGGLLQISGKATIDWDSDEVSKHPGAQRLVNIEIDRIVYLDNALPLRWGASEGAIREFRLTGKVTESADVTSFLFTPRDLGPVPVFKSGQYLPIELRINENESVERTYSLSNAPGEDLYRISVKREPQGLVSRLLHDHIKPGDIIYAQEPEGEFVLTEGNHPVALISAGIGITPMVSMLHTLAKQNRQVYFIHGARDGNHSPLAREVLALITAHENLHLEIVFSHPRPDEDIKGKHYHRSGRIDASVIEDCVPGLVGEFYVCGPKAFLATIVTQLTERGVDEKRIHIESFK